MANYAQNLVVNGLGTTSVTIPVADDIFVEGHMSLPTLTNGGGVSAALVVINKNGSPVYTGQAGAEGFRADIACAAGDVIAVVISSSAPADLPLNVIKTTMSIGSGE